MLSEISNLVFCVHVNLYQLNLIKHDCFLSKQSYSDGSVKVLNTLKKYLGDLRLFTPLIICIALF